MTLKPIAIIHVFYWHGAALRSDMIDSDCMAAINTLRMNEGNSVTLICDNPDFGGPNNAIECSGDWTNWQTKRFTGDRLLTSLQSALKAYFAWHGEEWDPTKQLTALRTAAAPFEDSRPVDEAWCREQFGEPNDSDDDECYWSESRAVIYFAGGRCTVNIGASRIFVNPTRGNLLKLLAALKPGGAK